MKKNQELFLCHYDISSFSKPFQFLSCVGGVFVFYLMYGYCQELIFNIPGFKPFGWYLTLVQFAFYSIFAIVEMMLLLPDKTRRVPLKTYFLLAFLTVGTMGMSNSSLGYLNYPTQVIFKCCKLIPVMFGGIFIQGKKYGLLDFLACTLMSVGLTLFILADSTVQPKFHYIGVIFMCLALCSDAIIGNVQEKSMKIFEPSNTEVVLYSYGIGFFYILLVLCVHGTFLDGVHFYNQEPVEKYGYTFLFSLSGYLGITFVLTMIRVSGALVTVTVTTCRKAVTIILSFLLFTKPFTIHYVWSGFIVLLGIAINIYSKNRHQMNNHLIMILHHPMVHYLCASCRPRKSKLVISV